MKRTSRSRISNGNGLFFDRPNGRTPQGRRFRDLVAAFTNELGGEEKVSEAQVMLVRRVVALSVQMETMESELVGGNPVDLGVYVTASNALVRLMTQLGLVVPIAGDGDNPTLNEYLTEKVEAQ